MTYRGEEAANQQNEDRWGEMIWGCLSLVVLIGGPITAGLWCHFTALEHGVTKLEVLKSTFETIINK
mgnify:CR=1